MADISSNNRNYKQFHITSAEDVLMVLGNLIVTSILNYEKYNEYCEECLALQKKYIDVELIPARDYEGIHDKVIFRQRELLTFMADEAEDTFSYKSLRKWLTNHEVDGIKLITRQLDQTSLQILNELHEIRNWTFHNVQSRIVAEKEYKEHTSQALEKSLGIKLIPRYQLNPLVIVKNKAYTHDMLASFIEHNAVRFSMFGVILEEMKRDYQDIYNIMPNQAVVITSETENLVENDKSTFSVKTMVVEKVFGLTEKEANIANISMAIQKRKYDGSKEAYKKCTQ